MKSLISIATMSAMIYTIQPVMESARRYNFYMSGYNACIEQMTNEYNEPQGTAHLNCI